MIFLLANIRHNKYIRQQLTHKSAQEKKLVLGDKYPIQLSAKTDSARHTLIFSGLNLASASTPLHCLIKTVAVLPIAAPIAMAYRRSVPLFQSQLAWLDVTHISAD